MRASCPAALEQRPRIAVFERQMRLAAAEIDAALERPGRVDQRDPHARSSLRRLQRRRAALADEQPVVQPSNAFATPTRGRHPVSPAEPGGVGHVPALVADTPIAELDRRRLAVQRRNLRNQLEQARPCSPGRRRC